MPLPTRGSPGLVVALGGGAVTEPGVRSALREHALTVWLDVDVETSPGNA